MDEDLLKGIEDLRFTDDFMFGAVMRNEHICKGVIERLLQIKIAHIEYPNLQKDISPFYSQKGVRLDVYVEGADKVFDIEAQTYAQKNLGRRIRYYQSMLDADHLMRGHNYSELKECYILFLCTKDPLGAGFPVYTFDRICRENPAVSLQDDTHHIIFNASAASEAKNKELQDFLSFLKNNEAKSDFTKEIADMVQTKKFEQTFINEYLAWRLHDSDVRERGFQQGLSQGLSQGISQGARQANISTAMKLLARNWNAADVAETTGLSLEDVQGLCAQSRPIM